MSSDETKSEKPTTKKVRYVNVDELRPEGSESSCLRPLGLCDLGACDVCWYNPAHDRFKKGNA